MNWYVVKIVFSIILEGNHTAQFDEQLRLIQAGSGDEAYYKGVRIGEQEEEKFYNSRKQLVQWDFVNVCEVNKIDGFVDGIMLYSRTEESDNPESYIDFMNKKAKSILQINRPECLL